jgi:hypothetical protein
VNHGTGAGRIKEFQGLVIRRHGGQLPVITSIAHHGSAIRRFWLEVADSRQKHARSALCVSVRSDTGAISAKLENSG